nr:hypothetical protein BdHM001_35250 [Bdellovibrio sp. HM001]
MKDQYVFWFDKETTGTQEKEDQTLSFAVVVKDTEGNEIERRKFNVRLKHGLIPNPYALTINKINPFSAEYRKSAVTENQLMAEIESLAKKYTVGRKKPILAGHNITGFDNKFLGIQLNRSGRKMSDLFSRGTRDTVKVARNLIAAGLFETKTKNKFGKSSAALGDVAAELGVKFEGMAHDSLADAVVSSQVYPLLMERALGTKNVPSTDVSSFEPGEVKQIISCSSSSGIKRRHIKILHNDPDYQKIIALDEDDIRKNGGLTESAIRTFNYDTILGEEPVVDDSKYSLNAYYDTQKDMIQVWENDSVKKMQSSKNEKEGVFDEDTRNFELIQAVSKRMVGAKDKKAEYEKCYAELQDKFGGDKISAKTVLTKAERLAEAEGHESWSRLIAPDKGVVVATSNKPTSKLKVALHPSGEYRASLDWVEDGEGFYEEINTDMKGLKKFLKDRGFENDHKDFLAQLPESKEFKDMKHPLAMVDDMKTALAKLDGETEDTKMAVYGTLALLKEAAPEAYKGFEIPEAYRIDVSGYWKNPDESGVAETQNLLPAVFADAAQPGVGASTQALPTSVQPSGEAGATISPLKAREAHNKAIVKASKSQRGDDHVGAGDAVASVPCALCRRPLSQALSVSFAMGPKCRSMAQQIDASKDPVSQFVSGFDLSIQDAGRGDLIGLKYIRNDGQEAEVFGEVISSSDKEAFILNRRNFYKMVKSGVKVDVALIMSTLRVRNEQIKGVGKVTTKTIKAQRDAA